MQRNGRGGRLRALLLMTALVSGMGATAHRRAHAQMVSVGIAGPAVQAADSTPLPVPGSLRWRNIGPNRGGRSITASGSPRRPLEYYFGATGGGLWKTGDGGVTWRPVTDGQVGSSSVGAVAVSVSDPDIVYIGMGETELRGSVLQGDGVYRSGDGGHTWTRRGLAQTQAIARIRIDPSDPDRVYVAALGHPFRPLSGRPAPALKDRGVFRSMDGGRTWQNVLYRDERTGAADLVIDPNDPHTLYASLWQVYRQPWLLSSGGPGSGLFKSTDGGDSWTELTHNPGLPRSVVGKITIAVSPADSRRIYANLEAQDGGLYRSDTGGATWERVNGDRDLWQRSFYFMRVVADPLDRETVYVLNFALLRSRDGGRSFTEVGTPHADHHDLWIDPADPLRMIDANDGGAAVSVNGGRTWTAEDYPTAQLYRVATTADFPYHVCGAQQDNTTVCVASRGGHLHDPDAARGDWFYEVGGGEDGFVAPDPLHPDLFFAGATNTLTRYDRRSGQQRDVQPYPRLVMGEPAAAMPERWSWVYPIVFSPLEPGALYAGSQHVWVTRDAGMSWRKISPDLTRAAAETMGDSGGPILLDQDGPEIYATIQTIGPSRHDAGTIWVGSDDGLVHLTRDGGASWQDVTPSDMPMFTRIGCIEASPHRVGTAYLAGKRYELDDRAPYIWKTHDFGATWTRSVQGIPPGDFVHVVREDPERAGLLYAGTEHGVYVSYDEGGHWQSLSLNLPDVEVIDLVVHGNDLVIATHGRSFYILDDVTVLRETDRQAMAAPVHLFAPDDATRRVEPAIIDYHLGRAVDDLRLEIRDAAGRLLRVIGGPGGGSTLPREAGFHRVTWDLRYAGATIFPGIVLEGGDPSRGPWAPPGRYQVRLCAGPVLRSTGFELRRDPRLVGVTDADLHAQFNLALAIRDRTTAANEAVLRIRAVRAELERRLEDAHDARIASPARALLDSLGAVERALYQTRNRSPKDKIAFPIRLNNRLSGLRGNLELGDGAPTTSQIAVFRELSGELDRHLARLERMLGPDLAHLNDLLTQAGLRPVPAAPGGMERPGRGGVARAGGCGVPGPERPS